MKDITDNKSAESYWEKADTAMGFALNASWNLKSKDNYNNKIALGYTYLDKFKKIYELFSGLQKLSTTIAEYTGSKTKKVKKTGGGSEVTVKPPNVCLGAEWTLQRASDNGVPNKKIGTFIKPYLKADPFVALEVKFDLLAFAVKTVSLGTTGNTAAAEVFDMVREWADKGYESERLTINFKMWMDAIFTGAINGGIAGEFNTESTGDTKLSVEVTSKIDLELSVGIALTGKVIIWKTGVKDGKAEGYGGEATAKLTGSSGKMGIELGGKVQYEQNEGLFFEPILTLQECRAGGVLLIEVKLSIKKAEVRLIRL
ncbi:hypothetical protein M601_002990 [Cellulophaga baltica 4]|nr:hypothetical protein M601_002990 [Cellulophaga baltica 4]